MHALQLTLSAVNSRLFILSRHTSKPLATVSAPLDSVFIDFARVINLFYNYNLPVSGMETVFSAIVPGKIFYALPVFYNYLTEHNKNQIRALF
jgi:hypothetical protein